MSSVYADTSRIRKVETTYHIEEVNEARSNGCICLIRRRELNSDLQFECLILRNRENGNFVIVPSRTVYQQYRESEVYSEDEWETVQEVEGYARIPKTECNWGAYILPKDPQVGEEFLIVDLIEDLVATSFWYSKTAATSAIATWDGKDLIIDHSSYRMILIG